MPGQVEQAVARLRFTLAQLRAKRADLQSLEGQYQAQLRRIPRQVLYGPTSIDAALGAMIEVEERLQHVRSLLRHLGSLEARVVEELDALLATALVEEARAALAALRARIEAGAVLSAADEAEMRRLEALIVETSRHAGDRITGHGGEGAGGGPTR